MKSISSVGIAIISGSLLICHFYTFVSCEETQESCVGKGCTWDDEQLQCNCLAKVQRKNLFPFSNQIAKRSAPCAHHRTECESTGDPHIKTFHGNTYNLYKDGVFTLVKRVTPPLWIQVNQSTRLTSWCNCGVLAREGNSIIGITSCTSGPPKLVEYQLDRHAPRGSICKITNGWKITLVSGIEIKVMQWGAKKQFLELYVTGMESEVLQYDGLCSIKAAEVVDNECDGSCENYRVKEQDNFFSIPKGTLPLCENNRKQDSHCGCYGHYPNDCPQLCSDSTITDLTKVCNKRKSLTDKKDEENDVSKDGLDDLNNAPIKSEVADRWLNMGYRFFDHVRSLKNPRQVLSVEDGRSRCNDALRLSPTYELCSSRVDTSEIVKNCALDENMMKDDEPAQSVPTELETVCLDNIRLSIEADASSQELKDLLAKVKKLVCPSQCSQNGKCVDSKCQCNEGFTGTDCSQRIGEASVVKK